MADTIHNPGQNPGGTSRATAGSETTSQDSQDMRSKLADAASSGYDELKRKATEELSSARELAEEQARMAAAKASEMASERKTFAARQVSGVAAAIERVGCELEREQPTLGRYAQELGRSVQKIAGDMERRDLREIATMAEDFGRRQPLAFLSAAALAGLAASRFMVASAERRSSQMPAYGSGMASRTSPGSSKPMSDEGRQGFGDQAPRGQSSGGQSAEQRTGSQDYPGQGSGTGQSFGMQGGQHGAGSNTGAQTSRLNPGAAQSLDDMEGSTHGQSK